MGGIVTCFGPRRGGEEVGVLRREEEGLMKMYGSVVEGGRGGWGFMVYRRGLDGCTLRRSGDEMDLDRKWE